MSTLHRASLAVAVIASLASLGGCAEDEGQIAWLEQPPLEQNAGREYRYAWQVKGAAEVEHAHLHACPAEQPNCKRASDGGPRIESTVILTGGETEHMVGGMFALPPGQWLVELHVRLRRDDGEVEDHVLALYGVVTATGVAFDPQIRDIYPAAGSVTLLSWRTHAPASESSLTYCNESGQTCVEVAPTREGDVWYGHFAPSEPGLWALTLRATIDGKPHASEAYVLVQ